MLFEAAAAGLPALSVPVGNSEEILDWLGGGLLVPAERRRDGDTRADVAALASAMAELLEDPQRLDEMGGHARAVWKQEFTWSTVASRYEELYTELMAAPRYEASGS